MHNRRNKSEVGQCVSSTVSDPFVQSKLLEGSHLELKRVVDVKHTLPRKRNALQ